MTTQNPANRPRALIAMSGGVDSSVAACLMQQAGYDCTGITMRLTHNETLGQSGYQTCCSEKDIEDAAEVAFALDMPYQVLDFTADFRAQIIEKFIRVYEAGGTPNPCIDCNKYMKFRHLLDWAEEHGMEYVVTGHYARVLAIVKDELLDMKKRFGDERRTEIQSVTGEVDIEDLIAEEQCVYTLTEAGYIKRQLKATYQAQRRGGRGISGMTRKEEDIVQEMFVGSTHDYVLFVTDRGRLFRIKGYTIAEGSRTSKGMNIVNLLQLAEGEKVTNMICQSKDAEQSGGYVTMVTKQGLIKRTPLEQYANIRKSGLIGIALNEGDALAWTRLTSGHDMLIVATRNGQAIRFNEEDARPMGRNGHGVRAIRLAEGDEVVGVCICREGGTVLTVTENGKGRRSDIDTYRITARGGKGIRNYDASKDKVAAVKIVDDIDDVLLSSQEGIIIRLHANEIPLQSRYGSGVRVMRLGENDKVMVLARTDHDDEAQTEKIDASEADAEPTAEQLAEMEAADAAAATEAPEADPEEKE